MAAILDTFSNTMALIDGAQTMAGPEKSKEAAKSDPMSPTDLAKFVSDSFIRTGLGSG